ncbi:hypothetical protein PoB_001022600 [Plakobranchus ocellatus]|uniref:Uncharacterized protein n=1 Tax=Plakobranchus ocellatus TaxID=259542 RepID=A0AAV3Y8Z1_9GAST|nr:hypothetical protein PoB_001022600 [Plakobranchus ocellatus]
MNLFTRPIRIITTLRCWQVPVYSLSTTRLYGPPSGQGVSGGARIRDRRVLVDHRAGLLLTVPPTSPTNSLLNILFSETDLEVLIMNLLTLLRSETLRT